MTLAWTITSGGRRQAARGTAARIDPDVVRRHLRQQDPLLLPGALSDGPLPQPEGCGEVLASS